MFVFGTGLLLRIALIARFPLVFGGDSMLRLLHPDRIFTAHQLPLLQIIVAAVWKIAPDYVAVMCAMAAIGAGVGVAFYLLARDFFDHRAAIAGALLMSVEPLVAAHSIVPYQESLMLLCVLMAFHYFYGDRYWLSAIWIASGCFTRYEAWIAALVLAVAYWWGPGRYRMRLAGFAFLVGPAVWMLYQRGLAPEGTYVIEWSLNPARLMRWVYLAYITAKFTPVIVLALSVAGIWFVWRDRAKRLWPLIAFVVLFSIALLFSAHGERFDPIRRVASREAHIWMAAVIFLAALAIEKLPRWGLILAAVGVASGAWGTYNYVAREAADPRLQLAYRLARFLHREMKPTDRVLILSPPWDRAVLYFYLERARETGGEAGYQAAVRNLAETADTSPPDFQRTVVHSRNRRQLSYEPQGCMDWIAVWSDYVSPPEIKPINTLRVEELSVKIAKRDCR